MIPRRRAECKCNVFQRFFLSGKATHAILYIYYETRHFIDCQRSEEMNPKHALKEYADALMRAGLSLTFSARAASTFRMDS